MRDVLVVDGDPRVRDFIGFTLRAAGIPYRTAAHGEQALVGVRDVRPGVILLDRDQVGNRSGSECMFFDGLRRRRAAPGQHGHRYHARAEGARPIPKHNGRAMRWKGWR